MKKMISAINTQIERFYPPMKANSPGYVVWGYISSIKTAPASKSRQNNRYQSHRQQGGMCLYENSVF
jgi:hypothetical protein